jgi:hypothetical protein
MSATLWTEDLTDKQVLMLADTRDNTGFELRGGEWATARALVRKGLGEIIGEGGSLPPMFWPNEEGLRIAHEFDEEDEPDECPMCGNCGEG